MKKSATKSTKKNATKCATNTHPYVHPLGGALCDTPRRNTFQRDTGAWISRSLVATTARPDRPRTTSVSEAEFLKGGFLYCDFCKRRIFCPEGWFFFANRRIFRCRKRRTNKSASNYVWMRKKASASNCYKVVVRRGAKLPEFESLWWTCLINNRFCRTMKWSVYVQASFSEAQCLFYILWTLASCTDESFLEFDTKYS